MSQRRQEFGIEGLDRQLGGGLHPGTLTVIAGATGAGKTQLGLRWAHEGLAAEGRRGVVCDLTSRGDSQHHQGYAARQLDWYLTPFDTTRALDLDAIWDPAMPDYDFLHPFARAGRRVTRRDLEPDDWHAWKTDLARVLRVTAGFFYGRFIRGVRRVLFDGVEPAERLAESIQFEFFEYLYQHVIRQDDDWTAREVLREHYRVSEPRVMTHRYDQGGIGCVFLYTTPHVMLDDLMVQPIGEGDIFANANTIIYLGRIRSGQRMERGLFVAKHRGSACGEDIVPYHIGDAGIIAPD